MRLYKSGTGVLARPSSTTAFVMEWLISASILSWVTQATNIVSRPIKHSNMINLMLSMKNPVRNLSILFRSPKVRQDVKRIDCELLVIEQQRL